MQDLEVAASRPVEVVTLGECMASFIALERGPLAEATTFRRTIAGAEANVAAGLERLGHHSAYIGRVGADGLGPTILRRLRGEGVDVSHLRVDAVGVTGVMIRELRDLGPAEVIYWRSGSAGARLDPEDVVAAASLFETASWLHLTGITPALSSSAAGTVEAALAAARRHGLRVSLDLNIRRRLWSEAEARSVLAELAARCDIVLGGSEEVAFVAGMIESLDEASRPDPAQAAEVLLATGPERVVVKLGPEGALERHRDGDRIEETHVSALEVAHVVDPVGAGDAFSAGFIAAQLEARPSREALAMANACGAAVVSVVGDQSGLPTRGELEHIMAGGGVDTLR